VILALLKAIAGIAQKEEILIPFIVLKNKRGQEFSVNAEIVQFIRLADNSKDECLVIFGKDQLLRVNGTLEEVTNILRNA
jgi:hypothetical protein